MKPVEIVWEGIRRRLSLLPVGVDANSLSISPDGKLLLMTASAAGQQQTFLWAIITLVIAIALINFFVWQKLLKYAERFKFE